MDRFGSKKTSITPFFHHFNNRKAIAVTNIFFQEYFIFFQKKMDRFGSHHKNTLCSKSLVFF